jgi:hypothetical protein
MSFPDNWWTTDLDDEPCDGCGVQPSKHAGHGSYTCESCYNARWCPKCKYALGANHVCPTPEQIVEYKKQMLKEKEFYKELGIDLEEE